MKKLGVFCFFFFLVSCSQMPLVSPQKLKIAISKDPSSLIVVSAEKEHYFADSGLRVETIVYENSSLSYQALLNGKVDFAVVDSSSFVFAPHPNVTILTELYASTRSLYFVVPDSKAPSLDEVVGTNIYVKARSSEEWFINLLSLSEGLNLNENRLMLEAFEEAKLGKVKKVAFVANALELKRLRASHPEINFRAFGSRVHADVSFLAGLQSIEKNEVTKLERLLAALSKAEERLRKDPDSSDRALADLLKVKNDKVLKEIREGAFYRMGLSNSFYVLLEEQEKWVRSRYQSKSSPLKLSDHFSPDFLRKTKAGSVTISESHFEAKP